MVNPQGENMARALDKQSGNMHIIILSVYYSLFFLLTDYGISVNASVIALTVLLFGYFVFNIKDFLHCTLTVPIAILIISVFTVLLNIRSLDYIKNNPMYLYSMIVAAVSIIYMRYDKKSRRYIMNILLAVSILSASVAIFSRCFPQFYLDKIASGLSNESFEYAKRMIMEGYSGVIGGRISLSITYIVCGLAICLGRFFDGKKKGYLVLALYLFIAVICTNRRSELLACICAFVVIFYMRANKEKKKLLLLIVCVAAVLLAILIILVAKHVITYNGDNRLIKSFFGLFNGEDISNGRIALYRIAWQLFCSNPITGIGFGNFQRYGSQQIQQVSNVHNIYLQLLCETGILGTIIIMSALIFLTVKLYNNFKEAKKKINFDSSYFSMYMMIFILVLGLFDNPIFQDTFWLLLCFIITCGFYNKYEIRGVK